MSKDDYLTKQIITYMGNKRKLIKHIEIIVDNLTNIEGRKLSIGDGFAGSGIVSRLFKTKASKLYTNDISEYSYFLNSCYLANVDDKLNKNIISFVQNANLIADTNKLSIDNAFVSKYWAPKGTISENHRVYFTEQNGIRIDLIRNYIDTLPSDIKPFILAPLIVKSSIHNNTNGQFSAFYKDGNIGAYGGAKGVDVKRITTPITIEPPLFINNSCKVFISKDDTNNWITKIPPLDLVYYDPPYNKHPYNIYYFLLDIIAKWDKTIEIPDTYRGQPKNWKKSDYNSSTKAINAFTHLIQNTKAKYIVISYNNGGILSIDTIDSILSKFGKVEKIPIDHNVYNRLKGISNYKRVKEDKKVQEFLWLLTTQ